MAFPRLSPSSDSLAERAPADVIARMEELLRAELTYPERCASSGPLPAGYHHLDRRASVGVGSEAFERAAGALCRWDMHRRAGFGVAPSSPVAVTGAVVVLRLGWGPVRVVAPCRVVSTVDELYRRGFAYGTLPGHPECGEESFTVELTAGDDVQLHIRGFSRPAWLLARVGAPVTRAIQNLITNRYLRALRTCTRKPDPNGAPR